MLRKDDFVGSCMDVVVYLCQKDPVLADNLSHKCKLQDMDLHCVKKNMRTRQPPEKLVLLPSQDFANSLRDVMASSKDHRRRKHFQQIVKKL